MSSAWQFLMNEECGMMRIKTHQFCCDMTQKHQMPDESECLAKE